MRRIALLLLKVAVSALLLYVSLRSVHLETVGNRFLHLAPPWLAAASVLLILQIGLGALRWRAIAIAGASDLPLRAAVQISFVALFFSQVLPSTIGGDAARIVLLTGRGGKWTTATYSVLIDRLVGLAALALIVVMCLPWTLLRVSDPVARGSLVLIGFGALLAPVVVVVLGAMPLPLFKHVAPLRHVAAAARIAWTLCRTPKTALALVANSLAIQLLAVAMVWACARALAVPVDFEQMLFIWPPVLLISTVPISIAGWGLRESSMIVAFGYLGLSSGDGLAVSILFGIVTLAVSALGGLVWIASGVEALPKAP